MEKKIGERIRKQRLEKGLTIKELAKRVGIGIMAMQRLETGKSPLSIRILVKIAQEFNKSINDFIDKEKEEKIVKVIKKKDIKTINLGGVRFSSLSPPGMIARGVSVAYLIEKKGTKIGPIKNERRWNLIYMVNGKVFFEIGNDRYLVKKGDSLYYNGNFEHSVIVEEDTEAIRVSIKE